MVTPNGLDGDLDGSLGRPGLTYLLHSTATAWWLVCEGQVYGPYATFPVALDAAVKEAEAAVACGFRSQIFAEGGDSGDHLVWSAGLARPGPAAA